MRTCTHRRNEMKSKAKTEKCPFKGRIRKRIMLTIDPDHYEYLKKTGVNVSRFLDMAINPELPLFVGTESE